MTQQNTRQDNEDVSSGYLKSVASQVFLEQPPMEYYKFYQTLVQILKPCLIFISSLPL